jgi:hypothetical protein
MSDDNSFKDIWNVLGFLLAGFGAVLSFLGLRSAEVTTVLRNDPGQASLIAFLLLLGVLAAVLTVATDSTKRATLSSAVAIVLTLFGVGALVIHAIPVGLRSGTTLSLKIGLVLVSVGIFALIASTIVTRGKGAADGETQLVWVAIMMPPQRVSRPKETTQNQSAEGKNETTPGVRQERQDKSGPPTVRLTVILIMVSVILIAISAYGAMRIETDSQLSFSAQVGASFSTNGRFATVSVNVAATKIPQADWVFIDVYAVPVGTKLMNMCESAVAAIAVGPNNTVDHCMTDPCVGQYFGNPNHPRICEVLLNGSIVPNATGNVDETLKAPFLTAKYRDVDVRAEVCSLNNNVCEGSLIGQNSRLDWIISNSAITPAN